jgi:hypothetical protein
MFFIDIPFVKIIVVKEVVIMLANEQRAHDLALLAVQRTAIIKYVTEIIAKAYCDNPISKDMESFLNVKNYVAIYKKILSELNEHIDC